MSLVYKSKSVVYFRETSCTEFKPVTVWRINKFYLLRSKLYISNKWLSTPTWHTKQERIHLKYNSFFLGKKARWQAILKWMVAFISCVYSVLQTLM